MRKYRKLVFFTLGFFIIAGMLFGYVPRSYAQDDQDWTKPVNLSLSGIATNPVLVIDFKNVLHTIWVDNIDGFKHSQSADGVTWTKPQTAEFPFDREGAPPVLLSDVNGSIHIFWINKATELFYSETTPLDLLNPVNWQTVTRLARNVVNYDVVLDSRGALHLAYIDNVNSEANPAGIYYRQIPAGASSWNAEIRLYESEYFRSATKSGALVRIATSNTFPGQKVYVAWDSQPQKRLFMATSNDSGLNWNQAKQIKDVEDIGGVNTPFNLNVAAANEKVLIIWQVGEPDMAQCSVFSQWSENSGESWRDTAAVFSDPKDCPTQTQFVIQNKDYINMGL